MSIASHRFAQGILTALGLAACAQTAGCPFTSGCGDPPVKDDPPHEVEIAAGCNVTIEGDDTTATECVPIADFGGACADPTDPAVKTAIDEQIAEYSGETDAVREVVCGVAPPEGDQSSCCYGIVRAPEKFQCIGGRPFVVGGAARIAALLPHSDWRSRDLPGAPASTLARETLAAHWAEDALFEHASIASFARFVLELLAVGAPPGLVRDAQRALADEIAHAELCFSLASRYAGRPVGPGALEIGGAALDRRDLASIAAAAVREGCTGETVSALIAEAAAEQATDPEAQRALRRIAAEETRHAELSFRFVAWALERGEAGVRDAVAAAFAEPPSVSVQAWPGEVDAVLRAHGRVSPRERRAIAAAAFLDVIGPCARALLHEPPVEALTTAAAAAWTDAA